METNNKDELAHKVTILHGFSNEEIIAIMQLIKAKFPEQRQQLVFAKTTSTSLTSKLGDLIADMSADHEYLKKNPPNRKGRPA